jgi:hypothetical protein
MFAGVPGTGIGGVFYVLLTLWMPLREAARAVVGRSVAVRWRLICRQLALVAGILAALAAEAWLLNRTLPRLIEAAPALVFPSRNPLAAAEAEAAVGLLAPALGALPFLILGAIALALQALRLLVAAGPAPPRIER